MELLRHDHPDRLLLKRGDRWDEALGHWKKQGRGPDAAMVVTSYGDTGARPLLRTGYDSGLETLRSDGSPSSLSPS